MYKFISTLIFFGAVIALVFSLGSPATSYEPPKKEVNEKTLFTVVNSWRTQNGYSAYTVDESLCAIAVKRVEQIKTDWSHDGFKEDWKWEMTKIPNLAENLSKDIDLLEPYILKAWLNSSTHRFNLEGDYPYSCIKCSGYFCVQIFGAY